MLLTITTIVPGSKYTFLTGVFIPAGCYPAICRETVMNFFKTILIKIKPVVLNKYLLALIIFGVWVTCFDKYNLIKRWKTGNNIKQLETEISFYRNEIENNKEKMQELQSSDENLEKFAREQYLMKKAEEDIFIFDED